MLYSILLAVDRLISLGCVERRLPATVPLERQWYSRQARYMRSEAQRV